jgi:polyhydroxybutyrate depolymerase
MGTAGTTGAAGTTSGRGGANSGRGGASAMGSAGRGGGSGVAGASGPAGTTGSGGASATTAGCGKTTWPATNDQSGGTPYTLTINGMTREYYINVPASYSSGQATRVVFAWHWLGGTARNVISGTFGGAYYGLKSRIPDAIYISAEGLGEGGQTGWPNTNGQDINFLKGMLEWLDANYCVDKTRIFSVGFSYGGMMSDTIACQMGSTFRAMAPIAGALFSGTRNCVDQRLAAEIVHGSADTTVAISSGITVRDWLIGLNHCTTTSQPIEPSPCVEYTGCDAGYPVVWCEHTGGHTVPSFAGGAIATFFQRF